MSSAHLQVLDIEHIYHLSSPFLNVFFLTLLQYSAFSQSYIL